MTQTQQKQTFTPGPWEYRSNNHSVIYAGNEKIAILQNGPNFGANAKLIVSAPELLAALKKINCMGIVSLSDINLVKDIAYEAITQAEER